MTTVTIDYRFQKIKKFFHTLRKLGWRPHGPVAPCCAATQMLHCHMAQSLPMGLARFLLAAQLAQSLPMGLCPAMRDCVLVLGLRLVRRDGGGWWRMVADGGGSGIVK